MMVRCEIAQSRGEVHGAKNNERHVCGRRRVGEAAVSCARSREGPKHTSELCMVRGARCEEERVPRLCAPPSR